MLIVSSFSHHIDDNKKKQTNIINDYFHFGIIFLSMFLLKKKYDDRKLKKNYHLHIVS